MRLDIIIGICVMGLFLTLVFSSVDDAMETKKEMNAMRDGTSTRVDGLQVYWEIKKFPDGHEYGMLLDDYSGFDTTKVMHLLHHVDCIKCNPANQFIHQIKEETIVTPKKVEHLRIEGFKDETKTKHKKGHCDDDDNKHKPEKVKLDGNN